MGKFFVCNSDWGGESIIVFYLTGAWDALYSAMHRTVCAKEDSCVLYDLYPSYWDTHLSDISTDDNLTQFPDTFLHMNAVMV